MNIFYVETPFETIQDQNSETQEESLSLPPEFKLWPHGTESQCAANELRWLLSILLSVCLSFFVSLSLL